MNIALLKVPPLLVTAIQCHIMFGAFGGIDYMTDRAHEFIENWEVESCRQSVVS